MRGATWQAATISGDTIISIHAPHAGRDFSWKRALGITKIFQSTRPMRGATIPATL